ncbi:TadE/TadG family type IV pilus assembly protein [Bradyrhizobium prioriisuperbiae]|uniref:TadE/TadG family type IV pilus assembly protein n=1 Tax=Bradyrhizobium prioriisuperbiae TaxID=2854389 RepID=UPI0028E37B86|nr:TadE/TadG family type IV pilus assembly protein [Bradyrhizobium prioritasuperba]
MSDTELKVKVEMMSAENVNMTDRPMFSPLRRFRTDVRGVSAIEFAIIAPFMVLLFFGLFDVFNLVTAKRKVTITARTLSDIISQATKVDSGGVGSALDASQQIMKPFPITTDTTSQTVSEIKLLDNQGKGTVVWSETRPTGGKTPTYKPGDVVTVPKELNPNNQVIYLVKSEIIYTYKPLTTTVISADFDLADLFYTRPRQSACVQYNNGSSTLPANC